MFDDLIREQDVAWAAELMGLGPDGFAPVGDDDSRLQAMLRLDTVDFEACPGSGKTTLLVAKLAVLAMRWPYRQQGICVLSHTNAARNEISNRLSNSAAGIGLTRYPHFVGTIHSFVNEYLALPWLRSKGLEVCCVDTTIALEKRWRLLPRKTQYALEMAHLTPAALVYTNSDYSGGSTGKFGPHTSTYETIVQVRREASEQGYFCFDEMFVWAKELLDKHPETIATLRQRFPLVFIDEAQDNSELQSALLHRIFCDGDAPSRRQRFGDSNQAIYAHTGQAGANTDAFPSGTVHAMPRSYRFGQDIANHVKGFGLTSPALIGAGPSNCIKTDPKPPVIFLFDDDSVQSVLPRYAAHLIEVFETSALDLGVFTAVAGVHDLDENKPLPHAIGHYVPSYDPVCTRKGTSPSNFSQYLARARFETVVSRNSDQLVNATALALLAASELAGGNHGRIARKSPHRRINELLSGSNAHENYLALQETILMSQGDIAATTWEAEALPHIEEVVRQLSGVTELNADVISFLTASQPQAAVEDEIEILDRNDNLFAYPTDTPQVRIKLGSIHSVKGETHTATLVLDSFFHKHHLRELKPWLLGKKSGGFKVRKDKVVWEGSRILGRLKLHYVAMTRPTHLLCLAMRWDAFDDGELDTLTERGWIITDCRVTAPV
ncbi:UvrD-helicase domain-containing protein [Acetobacter sp.]|uniref:UvrD-helicase domain-containing protein n=1 Tax=Acetobacter sp. TaxID=440 RepID=UPI0039EB132F